MKIQMTPELERYLDLTVNREDEPEVRLLTAIIQQAIKDYKVATDPQEIAEIEEFFFGGLFEEYISTIKDYKQTNRLI
jgi:hypothetical protein